VWKRDYQGDLSIVSFSVRTKRPENWLLSNDLDEPGPYQNFHFKLSREGAGGTVAGSSPNGSKSQYSTGSSAGLGIHLSELYPINAAMAK
jgi:hypothetical protein